MLGDARNVDGRFTRAGRRLELRLTLEQSLDALGLLVDLALEIGEGCGFTRYRGLRRALFLVDSFRTRAKTACTDEADRKDGLYAVDSLTVAHQVREWALEWGDDPRMRIALCGYDGEHEMPDSWACVAWKAKGGYGSQSENGKGRENAGRERIWFSPHCLKLNRRVDVQRTMFADELVTA